VLERRHAGIGTGGRIVYRGDIDRNRARSRAECGVVVLDREGEARVTGSPRIERGRERDVAETPDGDDVSGAYVGTEQLQDALAGKAVDADGEQAVVGVGVGETEARRVEDVSDVFV